MVTLANVRGADLAGRVGEILGQGFEAQNVRRRAGEAELKLEGLAAGALGQGGPSSQVVDDAALGRLGQVSPQMAQAVGQAQGNPEAAAELREQAQRGLTLSEELQALPDHAARLKRIAAEGSTIAAEGGDLGRLVALSNLDEGQLDLELQRMQLIGKDVLTSLPQAPSATDAFAALIANNPQVGLSLLGRRDTQIANERARRAAEAQARAAAAARARAAAGPQGPLAKGLAQIQFNLDNNFITEEQASARRARLQSEVASDPGVAADLAIRTTELNNRKAELENQAAEAEASGDLNEIDAAALDLAKLKVDELELKNEATTAARDAPETLDAVTDLGKVIQDEQAVTEIFGADSPQAAAFAELRSAEEAGDAPSLGEVGGIRKEFTSLSGDFVTMRNAVKKVNEALDSGAGDISLIFNYMKILDPNSVVRESEFATAEQTAGIPTRIVRAYNRAITGERLTETQREDFTEAANVLFNTQLESQQLLESEFTGIAERANINPDDVIIDFVGAPVADGEISANTVGAMSSEQLKEVTDEQIKAMDTETLITFIDAMESKVLE